MVLSFCFFRIIASCADSGWCRFRWELNCSYCWYGASEPFDSRNRIAEQFKISEVWSLWCHTGITLDLCHHICFDLAFRSLWVLALLPPRLVTAKTATRRWKCNNLNAKVEKITCLLKYIISENQAFSTQFYFLMLQKFNKQKSVK